MKIGVNLCLFIWISWTCSGFADERPNIILLMADDLGFSDLGCYGSEIATPNLDRLAQGGLRFSQFYNNGKCAPSRTALMFGVYPQRVRTRGAASFVTIAEILRSAGYTTLMTGRSGGLDDHPCNRGFDHFYGMLDACCNYFNPGLKRPGEPEPGRKRPGEQRPWARDQKIMKPYTPEDPDFYATDAFTDCALEYLRDFGQRDEPFFLYIPFTAPHFPLHARAVDIAKYRGRYLIGWDVIRQRRHQKLVELGLIARSWTLPDRDPLVPRWKDMENKDGWDLQMAVYAAMIDRMDQGIGRIMTEVQRQGIGDKTLVMFLSDNGACAEDYRAFNTTAGDLPPGPINSYRTQELPWAHVSNTPFRKYKWWSHEGGTATPFIAHWPAVIQPGTITHQVGHIMDIMSTCIDVAGAKSTSDDVNALPDGRSLLSVFRGNKREFANHLCWQFGQSQAVRQGKWKLVAGHRNPRAGISHFSEERADQTPSWELYDLEIDRTESRNVARKHPVKVLEMSKLYRDWFDEVSSKNVSP